MSRRIRRLFGSARLELHVNHAVRADLAEVLPYPLRLLAQRPHQRVHLRAARLFKFEI